MECKICTLSYIVFYGHIKYCMFRIGHWNWNWNWSTVYYNKICKYIATLEALPYLSCSLSLVRRGNTVATVAEAHVQRVRNDIKRTRLSCGRMIRLHTRLLLPPLPSASCLSFSVFPCLTRWGEGGGRGAKSHDCEKRLGPL
jgi:hypothetical protein